MGWQDYTVFALVAVATFYIARMALSAIRGDAGGCASCRSGQTMKSGASTDCGSSDRIGLKQVPLVSIGGLNKPSSVNAGHSSKSKK